MIKTGKSYCVGGEDVRFTDLANLQGETIKGVFRKDSKIYIILESGHAFWFHASGPFGIDHCGEKVAAHLAEQKERLKVLYRELAMVLQAAGEKVPPVEALFT